MKRRKKKPLEIDPEARAEVIAACDWYEAREPGLGRMVSEAFANTVDRILETPDVSSPAPEADDESVRRIRVHSFPFRVVFAELDNEIRVLAFVHDKRRPGYWLGRLKRPK